MHDDDERRTGLSRTVKASILVGCVLLLFIALQVLIGGRPHVRDERARAENARAEEQAEKYEDEQIEERERIDTDVWRNERPFKM